MSEAALTVWRFVRKGTVAAPLSGDVHQYSYLSYGREAVYRLVIQVRYTSSWSCRFHHHAVYHLIFQVTYTVCTPRRSCHPAVYHLYFQVRYTLVQSKPVVFSKLGDFVSGKSLTLRAHSSPAGTLYRFMLAKVMFFPGSCKERRKKFQNILHHPFIAMRMPASGYLVTARAERSGRGCDQRAAARIFFQAKQKHQGGVIPDASALQFPTI